MLTFRLTTKSNVPPYVQLAEQVRQALLTGLLREGDRLPTVREVVESIAINPNTVLKAYRELEREGLVEGRQGIGTFVLRRPDGPPPGTHALLTRGLASWIVKARRAGLRDADIESLVRATLMSLDAEATA
jgi:DNA-binding transcriptional regulator YhcF (GntR family)